MRAFLVERARRAVRTPGPLARLRLPLLLGALRLADRLRGDRPTARLLTLVDRRQGDVRAHGVLATAGPMRSQAPRGWDEPGPAPVTVDVPDLAWLELGPTVLNDTSLVVQGRRLIGPAGAERQLPSGMRVKGPGIIAHRDRSVLVEAPRPTHRSPGGIRLTGFGSGNWYHWLVEILPAAVLLDALPDELRDLPVLVPTSVLERAATREALELVLPGRTFLPVPRTGTIAVDRLVWIDSPVWGARTLRDGVLPSVAATCPNLSVLRAFRDRVLERLGEHDTDGVAGVDGTTRAPQRRVLLVRPPGSKRAANQHELHPLAERHRLELVDPGTLTFAQQVRLFHDASLIVGGWGAAWSSLLFAHPTTRGLMWAPELFRTWPLFANLAPVSDMELRHVFVDTNSSTFLQANEADQDVDVAELDAAIRAIDA
jgi:capsular polysaccharide biosynthesis protein